jgi:hypothetical protein
MNGMNVKQGLFRVRNHWGEGERRGVNMTEVFTCIYGNIMKPLCTINEY